ncbi:MAG: hypothetical protein ACHQET_12020 [Chitinophagales bacterium]
MAYPFIVEFLSPLEADISKDNVDQITVILNLIREIILKENYNCIKEISVIENTLTFKVKYWAAGSGNFMQTIRKGEFVIKNNSGDATINYVYHIGGVFFHGAALILLMTIVSLFTVTASAEQVFITAFLIFMAFFIVLWLGTIITQKLFF